MWHGPFGFHWFWVIPAFFLVLLATRLILSIIFFRRYPGHRHCWGPWGYGYGGFPGNGSPDLDPEAILKRRLASGQITEDEYNRLKETLTK